VIGLPLRGEGALEQLADEALARYTAFDGSVLHGRVKQVVVRVDHLRAGGLPALLLYREHSESSPTSRPAHAPTP